MKIFTSNDIIFTGRFLEWDFICKYETEYIVEDDATMVPESLHHKFDERGKFTETGYFTFDFNFYENDSFETEQTDTAFQVGQQINFGSKYCLIRHL